MTTAWASETFEFGGDLVRLTGRGIKEAEYFARVANGCDRVLAEKIFKAMRAVMVKLWAEGSLREEELRRRKAEMERDAPCSSSTPCRWRSLLRSSPARLRTSNGWLISCLRGQSGRKPKPTWSPGR